MIKDITTEEGLPKYRYYQCKECKHKFYSEPVSLSNLKCPHPCPICGDFRRKS